MFSRLTVAQRLSLGFGVILSLLIAVSLVGNNRVDYMNRTLVEASDGAAVKQRYAINFRGSVHDRAIAIRDAVLVENDRALEKHLADIDRLKAFYSENAEAMAESFREKGASAEEQQLLARIDRIEDRALGLTKQMLDVRLAGDIAQARQMLLADVGQAYTEWLARVNDFIEYQEDIVAGKMDYVREEAEGFASLIFLATGIAVVLSALIAWLIITRLRRRRAEFRGGRGEPQYQPHPRCHPENLRRLRTGGCLQPGSGGAGRATEFPRTGVPYPRRLSPVLQALTLSHKMVRLRQVCLQQGKAG